MNLGLEASAIVVRLRATATNTNMRELALLFREIAGVALKPVADFFHMELFMEVLPKIEWELHERLEVFRASLTLPFVASAVSSSSRFLPLGRGAGAGRASIAGPAPREACFPFSARRSGAGLLQIGNTFLQRL